MVRVVAVAGVGLLPARAFAAQGQSGGNTLSDYVPMHPDLSLTRDAFVSQLRQNFVIYGPGNVPIAVKLASVRDCPNAVAAGMVGSQTCFLASFESTSRRWLPAGTYLVDTPQYGRMELFVKLTTVTAKKSSYEVVVNRLDRAAAESAGLPPGI
jgi:hypothetical protein